MTMDGFRAASAFVEVSARLDDREVLAAARRAVDGIDSTMIHGMEGTGQTMTEILSRSGDEGGRSYSEHTTRRLHDERARFIMAGISISENVRKGVADDSDKGAFRSFLGLVRAAPKAGADAAKGLVESLRAGTSGPAAPYIYGGLLAGAVVTGPAIGSLLAAGITTGIAGAAIGGGIALALKDPEVKHAASETGENIGEILRGAAAPFRGALLDVFDRGERAVQRWEPKLKRMFAVSATFLDPLMDGLERFGDSVLTGVVDDLEGAGPVIDMLGEGIAETGDAIKLTLSGLSDNGAEMAVALRGAFLMINGLIAGTGLVINGLTETFGWLVERFFDFGDLMGDVGERLAKVPGPIGEIGRAMTETSDTIGVAEGRWRGLKGRMTEAMTDGQDGAKGLSQQTKLLTMSMGAAVEEAGSLSKAFKLLNGGALDAREAESQYQAAIDDATTSMKENGKTLDLHTAKGRANDAALRRLISATDAKAQATYDETAATKGSAAAETAAAKVYAQGREQLIKSAMQMGKSRREAEAYADRLMKIPKTWGTTVTLNDQASVKARLIDKTIRDINGKTVTVKVKYETSGSIPGEHIIGRGTVPKNRWGGLYEKAATGLLRQADTYSPQHPGRYMIAEPETGGEAFVPRYGDRARSLAILQQAAGWNKATVVPNEARGAMGGTRIVNHFAPGSIVLDASRIKSVRDLIEMLENLGPAVRAWTGRSVGRMA